MDNTTNNHIPLCLAVGAGAIGKSISGYIFSQLGYRVVFADISAAVIDDINRRGGYLIETAETGRNNTQHFVHDISAYNIGDKSVKELAINADYICTAIGPSGMKASLPVITDWIAVRNKSSTKPLYILLFENDMECRQLLLDSLKNAIGHIPQWLKVVKTSIERMTKPVVHNDTEYDIVAEKFIPVIANRSDLENSSISRYPQYFMLVRDVEAYYYRKLFTNNLGHAVISYIGIKKGYKTTCEAMNDKYITGILSGVFSETTSMLEKLYDFDHDEMQAHISSLYSRYKNPGMADSLFRLAVIL